MRSIQRGIATSIILIIFLIAGVAIASGYFIFYQNQQKLKSINSFKDCAKYYPVMESYPEQCNTPDGKHFVRELSDDEKQKLVPPSPLPEASPAASTPVRQLLFNDPKFGFSLSYPSNLDVDTSNEKYSFMTTKNVPTVNFSKKDYNDYLNWFSIDVTVDDNTERLSAKQLLDRYIESLKSKSGPESKYVVGKINETRRPYRLGVIKGEYALFGADYDYDVIIFTNKEKIYTILYTGNDGGKVSKQAEEEINKILSTFKFLE